MSECTKYLSCFFHGEWVTSQSWFFSVLRRSHEGILESDGYHSNSEQSSTKSANHHHRHPHNRHPFHQVPDWTGHDVFAHPSQQNVYNPNHEDNAYRPHHGTAEAHRHGYGDIPERQEADGGADDHTEVGHMPGHYHYHQLYQYAAYYRLITEDLLNFF